MNRRAEADNRERRREVVARLRLRGLSMREIAAELVGMEIANKGEPWSHATIENDIKAMKAEWRANAAVTTAEHSSREFAEIGEGKRQSWRDGDLAAHARYLKMEIDLLGTNAPVKIAPTNPAGTGPYDPSGDIEALQAALAALDGGTESGGGEGSACGDA